MYPALVFLFNFIGVALLYEITLLSTEQSRSVIEAEIVKYCFWNQGEE